MASKIQIINQALRYLGEQPINALDEGSEAANIVSDIYDISLETELRSWPFTWATTTAELAQLSDETPPDFGYAYQLPANYLQFVRIVSTPSGQTLATWDPWTYVIERYGLEWEIREGKLYCDLSEITIKYIFNQTDTSKWDSHFVEAFSYKLAEKLAIPLAGRNDLEQLYFQKYLNHIAMTRASNGAETRRRNNISRDYITSRAL